MGNRKPYKQDYFPKRSFYSRDADFIKDIETRYKTDNPANLPRRLKRSYRNAKAREAKRISDEVYNKLTNKTVWEEIYTEELKGFNPGNLIIDDIPGRYTQKFVAKYFDSKISKHFDSKIVFGNSTLRVGYISPPNTKKEPKP